MAISDKRGKRRPLLDGISTEAKQDDIINTLSGADGNFAIDVQEKSDDVNITYVGIAAIGSLTSQAVWQIYKIDETTGTIITWADGDELFNNIYDDRESLSYS